MAAPGDRVAFTVIFLVGLLLLVFPQIYIGLNAWLLRDDAEKIARLPKQTQVRIFGAVTIVMLLWFELFVRVR